MSDVRESSVDGPRARAWNHDAGVVAGPSSDRGPSGVGRSRSAARLFESLHGPIALPDVGPAMRAETANTIQFPAREASSLARHRAKRIPTNDCHLRKKGPPPSRRNAPCPPSHSRSARPVFRSHQASKNHPKTRSIRCSGPIRELHSATAAARTSQNGEQCLSHTRQAHPTPATYTI